MADERRPRPVSGEIMTDAQSTASIPGAHLGEDIVDAEYETVVAIGRQPENPVQPAPTMIASPVAPLAGMEMLRRPEGQAAQPSAVRGGPVFWVFGIGLAAAAFWVSGGHALVRGAPFLSAQAPRQALSISGVASRVDATGARPVLFVDGQATNDGAALEMSPPLDIIVTGHDGRVTRYRLGTSGRPMASGETFAFSSRLDVPKNGVKTVSVTFGDE